MKARHAASIRRGIRSAQEDVLVLQNIHRGHYPIPRTADPLEWEAHKRTIRKKLGLRYYFIFEKRNGLLVEKNPYPRNIVKPGTTPKPPRRD